jgi:SAM-dependent methyltransferase
MTLPACSICGSAERDVLYEGPIRNGRFGDMSAAPETVWRCRGCGAGRLYGSPVDYTSDEYRTLVDGADGVEAYHRLHDEEQADKLHRLGTAGLRGTVLADVGCGAGAFLDLVRGYCRATIGIEPSDSLRRATAEKGHAVYADTRAAHGDWAGRVDLAVCFSVIEHVDDALGLLRDVQTLLKPGGSLVLSTPNRRDFLIELLPDYARFFYRRVHVWYFDADSLTALAARAGFATTAIEHVHRFDVSNAALWLRDRRPTGLAKLDAIPAGGDALFRALLEAAGRSDYLYGRCRKAD